MDTTGWQRAIRNWREQELALFARRAHRHLGRGFVLSEGDDDDPVYVTWLVGAPEPLVDAVYGYDPEREALVVSAIEDQDSFVLSRVRIEKTN